MLLLELELLKNLLLQRELNQTLAHLESLRFQG